MSMQQGNDALSLAYNETKLAFRSLQAHDLVTMFLAGVADIDFDEIAVTYNETTDVFVLKKASATVTTLTVTYSDATKAVASGLAQS